MVSLAIVFGEVADATKLYRSILIDKFLLLEIVIGDRVWQRIRGLSVKIWA